MSLAEHVINQILGLTPEALILVAPKKCIFSHFPGEGEATDLWTAL